MNAPLNTSVVLAIAVALWLIWVAPFFLRLRTRQFSSASSVMIDDADEAAIDFEPMKMMKYSPGPQEAVMTGTNDSVTTGQRTETPGVPFKIKYDRAAIALAGALAAPILLIGLVLSIVGVWSVWVPVLAFLVLFASVATLRALAIRDRKGRADGAFRQTAGTSSKTQTVISASKTVPAETKPAELFDAQHNTVQQNAAKQNATKQNTVPKAPAPLTAAELRRAALAVAEGAEIKADGTWEPVAVPKPSYVEAAKVERPAPAPLELPEQPKAAARTSIKKAEAGVAKTSAEKGSASNAAALNNLDDVLQRRRA